LLFGAELLEEVPGVGRGDCEWQENQADDQPARRRVVPHEPPPDRQPVLPAPRQNRPYSHRPRVSAACGENGRWETGRGRLGGLGRTGRAATEGGPYRRVAW